MACSGGKCMPFSLGGGARGALGGAASGAALGSAIFPGIGTAIGAGIGGLAGLFGGGYGDSMAKKSSLGPTGSVQKIELYTPEQKAMMQQLGSQGLGGLQALLGQPYNQLPSAPAPIDLSNLVSPYRFDFAPIAQQARTQFQTQTVPSLAERFTALGGQTRPGTASGLIGQLGAAGAGLEEGLAALASKYGIVQQQNLADQALRQAQLQLQQQGQQFGYQSAQPQFLNQQQQQRAAILQNLLGIGLGQQFQPLYTPPAPQQPGFWQSIAPALGQAVGNVGSLYAANKLGLV